MLAFLRNGINGTLQGRIRNMKFYISTSGIKKVTISSSGKGAPATASRRVSSRTFLPVVLVLGILLPFLFVRIAFLVLESATACSSTIGIFFFSSFIIIIIISFIYFRKLKKRRNKLEKHGIQ